MLEDPSQLNRPGDATPDLARARGPVAVKLAYLVRSSIKSEHHLFHSPRQPGCEGTRTVTAPLVLQRVLGGSPLETRAQRVRVGTPSEGAQRQYPRTAAARSHSNRQDRCSSAGRHAERNRVQQSRQVPLRASPWRSRVAVARTGGRVGGHAGGNMFDGVSAPTGQDPRDC